MEMMHTNYIEMTIIWNVLSYGNDVHCTFNVFDYVYV